MPRRLETATVRSARLAMTAAVLGGLLVIAGCSGGDAPTPSGSPSAAPSATAAVPTSTPTPSPSAALVPGGTAADNLPLFTAVTAAVAAGPESSAGRAYIDALAAAGFDKAAMQVTFDETTIGNPADSVLFSVRWGEECLVGQIGPAIGAPLATVVPGLSDGSCLVGNTRPIDW